MYKRDKAIKDIKLEKELFEVINNCKVCHIGFVDNAQPYVLAFCFGFDGRAIFLHCAKEGRKINILEKNNNVCIEFDAFHELFARDKEMACSWRMPYKSVLIFGKAQFITDYDLKVEGLKTLMKNYSDLSFNFSAPSINNINVIKIDIAQISGRKFEYL